MTSHLLPCGFNCIFISVKIFRRVVSTVYLHCLTVKRSIKLLIKSRNGRKNRFKVYMLIIVLPVLMTGSVKEMVILVSYLFPFSLFTFCPFEWTKPLRIHAHHLHSRSNLKVAWMIFKRDERYQRDSQTHKWKINWKRHG